MNTYTESDHLLDVSQKWEIPFRQLLDEIYYEGFSEQLAREDIESYNREYYYFISLYD